jgi:hypothetical protein
MNLSEAKCWLGGCFAGLALCGTATAGNSSASGAPEAMTNTLGMEFIRLTAGSFTVGAGTVPPTAGAEYDEQPAHQVTISEPFYLLKLPVSQADFARSGLGRSAADVSWNDAAAFCAWLSKKEQRTYRLPTEAEWVFASQSEDFGPHAREWVQDWHANVGFDPVTNPCGPITGLTKVIREGTKRLSLSPDATSSPWGLPVTSFRMVLEIEPRKGTHTPAPFTQSAVKQGSEPALLGPNPKLPYFTVRFALPIPPENDTNLSGPLTGLDQAVMAHQHSPGFEILPNGDALAIYFSAKDSRGESESDSSTRFVQARLRYGAEEWDPPELFYDFKQFNEQSGLLWREGHTVRFFGGGRGLSSELPFKMAVSTNNGVNWTLSLPRLDAQAQDFTAQPIVNAFRGSDGAIYFAMDAAKDASLLWRSSDDGVHWHDMGGRTAGRHSTIVPLDDKGNLLSIGGKRTSINGWSPLNRSSDWGANWAEAVASPFPALGGNQRPCMIRLANGHLFFATDSYNRKDGAAPAGWKYGAGCVVAVSTNNGAQWRIKRLPVELPHEADQKHGTLGYATVREAPNGVIHLLATMTHPCVHYEFNEAWVFSDAGDIQCESSGGVVRTFTEQYPNGKTRLTWSARICPNGRYLLEGTETAFYESGKKEHEAMYSSGRKTGTETYWTPEGVKLWSWKHDLENHRSTWVHYWSNGRKRVESTWTTYSQARDVGRNFFGLVANGPAYHWSRDGTPARAFSFTNGVLQGPLNLQAAQL